MKLRVGEQFWQTLGWLSCCLALGACAARQVRKPVHDPWQGRGRECIRPFLGRDSPYSEVVSTEPPNPVLGSVPAEAHRTMTAAGLGPLVARALQRKDVTEPVSLELLNIRQDLGMRLISLETQLAAVIFEAECTGELIEAMAFELEDRGDQREVRLAVASLVVGAAAATAAGIWDLAGKEGSIGPAVLGLSGGISSAALGAAAFVRPEESMRFMHEHNLLAPVVEGQDQAELFPAFVFRLMTLPGAGGAPSPRDRLLQRFDELIAEVVPAGDRERARELLYGPGGRYDQALIALRERMYDALESELNAQARDLELLDRFLVRALAVR